MSWRHCQLDAEPAESLNIEMVDELCQTLARAAFDPEVRAIVVRAASEHYFMAGSDL